MEKASQHLKKYEATREQINQYQGVWDSIAKHFCPFVKFNGQILPGDDVTFDIYNNVGIESILIFANGVTSWVMQQGSKWFNIEPAEENVPDEIKRIFSDVSDRLFKYITDSNLSQQMVVNAMYSACFNLSVIQIDKGVKKKLRYRTLYPGKFTVCSNEDNDVYELFREFDLDLFSLVQEFGYDALPQQLKDLYNTESKANTRYCVVHHIWERKEYIDDVNVIPQKRRFGEVYLIKGMDHILKEDGRYTFPFAVVRLLPNTNGEFGNSIAELALDSSVVLQKVEEDLLINIEKMAKQSYYVPSDYEYNIDDSPGAKIYYNPSSMNSKPEPIQYNQRVDVESMGIQRIEDRIRRNLFVDTFQLLKFADREKTAFETSQLLDERTIIIAPMLSNYLEQIKALILATYNILNQDGVLFTEDEIMKLADYFMMEKTNISPEVKFNNKVSLLIKKLRDNGIIQSMTLQAQAMQMGFEDARFVIKIPEALREVVSGEVPAKLLYSEDEVIAIKQMQAQIAQEQAQMQQAQQMADVAKTMPQDIRNKFGV